MKLKHYWNLLRGKTNALHPAKFDLRHIWAVTQSWVRSLLPVPQHIKEQIEWREWLVKKKSPLCWVQGSCIQCGCEIKGKIKADMACENEPYCFPEMMGKKEWKEYSSKYGLFHIYKK